MHSTINNEQNKYISQCDYNNDKKKKRKEDKHTNSSLNLLNDSQIIIHIYFIDKN